MSSIPKIKKVDFYCPTCWCHWQSGDTSCPGASHDPLKEGDDCPFCKGEIEMELRKARKMVKEADEPK